LPALKPGHYFYQVTVTDSKGHWNTAFDTYEGVDDINRFGVKEFYID